MATMVKRDIDIQKDVQDELSFDPEVEPSDIGVAVDDGVVTLAGTVKTYAEKWAAERAAFRVDGVRALANEITVKLPGAGIPNDAEIAMGIADVFAHNILIPKGIDIRVEQGGVTLSGTVQWQYQRNVAEKVARATRGVKWVSDLIYVAQPPVAPDEIERGIKQALVRSAAVDADRVHVVVRGGHATLTGTVRSWAERRDAQSAAWRAKGVTAVTNEIIVAP